MSEYSSKPPVKKIKLKQQLLFGGFLMSLRAGALAALLCINVCHFYAICTCATSRIL